MSRSHRRRNRRGFTLIEVMLVLVILVILASLAGVQIMSAQRSANIRAAKSQVGMFKTCIESYQLDLNQYPTSLEALITSSGDSQGGQWSGPYLDAKQVPLDPWRAEYRFASPGTQNPDSYDVWSMGPDGSDGTEDDIGNW